MISLADLQRRIESGELSADAALAQSVEAIDTHDKTIGAFVCRAEDPRDANAGPLRGIAVGIKDIIDTSDLPTEMGSKIYRGFRPRADAPVVMLLKQAGATVAGKTTTTAFAANDPTATLNPRNTDHTPGGSSSGSAAAVAAGMIPLALGTQTGGSVIRPASFCGVAAIKPSFRLLPTVGVKCFSWTLDTVGLFAAGVEDLAQGLSAMTGRAELRLGAAIEAPRIGVVTQDFAGAPEAGGRGGAARTQRPGGGTGRGDGATALALPEIIRRGVARSTPTAAGVRGASVLCLGIPRARHAEMAPLLRGRLDESRGTPARPTTTRRSAASPGAPAPRVAQHLRRRRRRRWRCPRLARPPEGTRPRPAIPRFNRLWTLLGAPCVNVPAYRGRGRICLSACR